MLAMFKYKIIKGQNILIRCFGGIFSIDDVIQYVKLTSNDDDYSTTMNVLNDLRNAEIRYDDTQLKLLVEFIKNNHSLYGKRKTAFLVQNPEQTVFSMLLDYEKKEDLINMKIFTTLDASLDWLEISKNYTESIEFFLNQK